MNLFRASGLPAIGAFLALLSLSFGGDVVPTPPQYSGEELDEMYRAHRMVLLEVPEGRLLIATSQVGNGIIWRNTSVYVQGVNSPNYWKLRHQFWVNNTPLIAKIEQLDGGNFLTFTAAGNVRVSQVLIPILFSSLGSSRIKEASTNRDSKAISE